VDFATIFGSSSILAKLCLLMPVLVVATSVAYAVHPDERRLALMRPLSLATIFAALSGFSVGLISVLNGIGATEISAVNWRAAAVGTAETLVVLFIAFGCLTLSWLIVALGMRRS
jgi:hypothetical protein